MTCKRTARRPPRLARLDIDSLAFGGDAVGRDREGRVVFVPGAAPGDGVEVEIEEEKKGYARARLARVLRPGAARVEPPCPRYLDGCGGCQWQHVALEAQRSAKADVAARALRAAGVGVDPLDAPAPAFGWRRRARLRFRRGVVGYAERRSHRLVDVDLCPQLEPPLERALQALRAGLAGQLDDSGEIELLLTGRGEVHAVVSGAEVDGSALVGQAGIAGIDCAGRRFGAARVDLADDDLPFWARADVFTQASAAGNLRLRQLVRDAAGPVDGLRVLELFAGSGNFSRDLARGAARLVAVEESAAAVALARDNLALRGLDVELRAEPAERALGGERFDLVVVDPPRTGLPAALAAALAEQPARIVYISCDPATLARDVKLLQRRVQRVTPLDLMPQTFHIELVAVLASP